MEEVKRDTPSSIVYHFCAERGICVTCHTQWAEKGFRRCRRCNNRNARYVAKYKKKQKRKRGKLK